MNEPLRVALVGCGRIAEQHASWIARLSGARLVAAVDTNAAQLATFTERHGVERRYGSLDALLDAGSIDVIHIASPAEFHHAQAAACLDAKLHVLLEKPCTLKAADAEDLVLRAQRAGCQLSANFVQLHHPAFRQLRSLWDSGALGQPVWVQIYFGLDLMNVPELRESWPPHWSYGLPGGVLHNYVTHPLYLAASLIEPPIDVDVHARSVGLLPQGVTDRFELHLRGRLASATIVVAVVTGAPGWWVRAVGTEGSAVADFTTHAFTHQSGFVAPGAVRRLWANPSQARQLLGQTARLIWQVARGKVVPGLGLGALLDGFYESIRTGAGAPVPTDVIVQTAHLEDAVVAGAGRVHLKPQIRPSPAASGSGAAVLVTGATGYLGPWVVRELTRAGYRVRALTRPTSFTGSLETLPVEFVHGDLRDHASVLSACDGVECVINLAAALRGRPDDMLWTATAGIHNLAEAARAVGVKRVLHVSSFAVYDYSARATRRRITETSPLDARGTERGAATRAKLEAERLALRCLNEAEGPAWTILRPALLFGGGRSVTDPLGVQVGSFVLSFGRAGRRLRLIHVSDAAVAVRVALEAPGTRGRVYNLSHPDAPTARQYCRAARAGGARFRVLHVPYGIAVTGAAVASGLGRLLGKRVRVNRRRLRYLFVSPAADMKRFTEDTGWSPAVPVLQQVIEEVPA